MRLVQHPEPHDAPAIITGTMFFMTSVGCMIPMLAIPTPAFAVPYAAPRSGTGGWEGRHTRRGAIQQRSCALEKTSAADTPMKPKNAALEGHRSTACRRRAIFLVCGKAGKTERHYRSEQHETGRYELTRHTSGACLSESRKCISTDLTCCPWVQPAVTDTVTSDD